MWWWDTCKLSFAGEVEYFDLSFYPTGIFAYSR